MMLIISVPNPDPWDDGIHMLSGLPDPDPNPLVRCMDSDPSIIRKKGKKNLDSYRFVTTFDFLSLKNDVNVPPKSNEQKPFFNSFFDGVLKVNDENSRIRIRRIRIRTH